MLCSTCAIPRVAMGGHSIKWKNRMVDNNLEVLMEEFYVDDDDYLRLRRGDSMIPYHVKWSES